MLTDKQSVIPTTGAILFVQITVAIEQQLLRCLASGRYRALGRFDRRWRASSLLRRGWSTRTGRNASNDQKRRRTAFDSAGRSSRGLEGVLGGLP